MLTGILGSGVYSFPEAARLVAVPARTLHRWFRSPRPLLDLDYPPFDVDYAMSFANLIEAYVAGLLCAAGLPTKTIRRVRGELHATTGDDRPFRVRAPGHRIGGVTPTALRRVDYDPATRLAVRWRIAPGVVVDPRRRFGAPMAEGTGMTTWCLAGAARAEGSVELAARWYEVEPRHVRSAVAFEGRMTRRPGA